MQSKKIILVTGATGAQGGSVARALLQHNNFSVRIFTRNAQSPQAIALEAAGAEIFQGDLEDTASLAKAVEGCYGVYGVTNFWEHFEKEAVHGRNLINAVMHAGVEHFIFHTLPDYQKISNGMYRVPHCDIKASLQHYAASVGIPATFIHMAFYYENFLSFFPPQKGADGKFHVGFPQGDTKLAMASVEDLGYVVAAIFNHPSDYIGRTVGVVGDDQPCQSYAASMSAHMQQDIQYSHIPYENYAALGFPGAEELAAMFEVQRLFIKGRQQDLEESRSLYPGMRSFDQWMAENKGRFRELVNPVVSNSQAVV